MMGPANNRWNSDRQVGETNGAAACACGGAWTIRVQFADAVAVYLMGRFNNWSTCATPMQQLHDGRWVASLNHDPGDEAFYFYVWCEGYRFGRIVRHAEGRLEK